MSFYYINVKTVGKYEIEKKFKFFNFQQIQLTSVSYTGTVKKYTSPNILRKNILRAYDGTLLRITLPNYIN